MSSALTHKLALVEELWGGGVTSSCFHRKAVLSTLDQLGQPKFF